MWIAFSSFHVELICGSDMTSARDCATYIETRWSAKQMLYFHSNPCSFHLDLEVRNLNHETTGFVANVPSSYRAKTWKLCRVLSASCCLKGSQSYFGTKIWTWYSLCHSNSHVFHKVFSSFSFWLYCLFCNCFLETLCSVLPKCDLYPRRHIWWL